jgi:nucleoside permease NupC
MIVLRWSAGYAAFQWLGDRVTEFYVYSDAGAQFVFGDNFTDHFFAFKARLSSLVTRSLFANL